MNDPSEALHRAHPALVVVAGALGAREGVTLEGAFRQAAREKLDREVEEVMITALFVLGFPATLDAWELWASIRQSETSTRGGVGPGAASTNHTSGLFSQAPESGSEPPPTILERGIQTFRDVYGAQAEPLRGRLRALNPDLEDLILRVGYGEMMGRPGLPLSIRETCLVAMLTSTGAWRQLYSHLRGGFRCGVSSTDLQSALEAGIAATPADRRTEAKAAAYEVWAKLTSKDREETSR